jgi:hypothetical protein
VARFLAESKLRLAEVAAESFKEMIGEDVEVIAAIAQRGNGDGDGGDTEVEIFAEELFADALLKVAVGGGNDADVYVNGLRAADAFKAAFFEDAKELGLAGEREFADFVEEERAALGQLDLADLAIAGAGKRAFFMAEEFVFDEIFGDGGAIERDERADRGDRKCDGWRGRRAPCRCRFRPRRRTVASVAATFCSCWLTARMAGDSPTMRGKAVAGSELFAQDEVFAEEFLLPGGALDQKLEMVEIDGFWMKSKAPSFMAETASSTEPKAVRRMTGMVESACLDSRSTSRPEAPGIFRSVSTIW